MFNISKWKIMISLLLTVALTISISITTQAKEQTVSPGLAVYGTTVINTNIHMGDCFCEFSYQFYKKEKGKWKLIYKEVDRTPEQTEIWEVTKPGKYAMTIKNIAVPEHFSESKKETFTIKDKKIKTKVKKTFYRHPKSTPIIMKEISSKRTDNTVTLTVGKKDSDIKLKVYGVEKYTGKIIKLSDKKVSFKKYNNTSWRATINFKKHKEKYLDYIVAGERDGKEIGHTVVSFHYWYKTPFIIHYSLTNARLK